MVPARPTIQQIFSEGAEPAVRSASTLLVCRDQDAPPSLENSIMPAWPARQSVFLLGVTIRLKSRARAMSALETRSLPNSAEAFGAGGAAARRATASDSDFDFFPADAPAATGLGASDFCAPSGLGCKGVWAFAVSVGTPTVCVSAPTGPGFASLSGWFRAR